MFSIRPEDNGTLQDSGMRHRRWKEVWTSPVIVLSIGIRESADTHAA